MPFFKGCTAESATKKYTSTKNVNGILHKISDNCIAQVILYSTEEYLDFCIFAYCMTCHDGTLSEIYNEAKKEVENNNIKSANYCILKNQPLEKKKPVIVNLPMRKNNILCFFPKGSYNTSTGLF